MVEEVPGLLLDFSRQPAPSPTINNAIIYLTLFMVSHHSLAQQPTFCNPNYSAKPSLSGANRPHRSASRLSSAAAALTRARAAAEGSRAPGWQNRRVPWLFSWRVIDRLQEYGLDAIRGCQGTA